MGKHDQTAESAGGGGYRDTATPQPTGDEVTLVQCQLEVRQGVYFGIVVTDRSLRYLRPVSFRMKPFEWVEMPLDAVHDVALSARSPWPLRLLGVALGLTTLGLFGALSTGVDARVPLYVPLALAAGTVGCFVSARSRVVLAWRADRRRHRVEQPVTWEPTARDLMTLTLQKASVLLTDPAARHTAVLAARARNEGRPRP
jgi:hypothetical protein